MAPAVEVNELVKRFGRFVAVDRVSFRVEPGEVFGFLGSNGAGKTTTIRILCGLLPPSSGSAFVLGIDVARDPDAVKKRIGYMSQRFSLYEDLTPRENLTFYGGVYGLSGAELERRSRGALEKAGLQGRDETLTRELPGGFRQRLALACALLHEPAIVFLDEPTGGVDPLSRRRFWGVIEDLSASGVTVFVTTHYMDEAERCGRLALMHSGKLLALGSLPELRGIFRGRAVLEVRTQETERALSILASTPWVEEVSVFGAALHVVAPESSDLEERVRSLLSQSFPSAETTVRAILPSLEDVFIRYIESYRES